MGALIYLIDDDFKIIRKYGYISDDVLYKFTNEAIKRSFSCLSFISGCENTMYNSEQMLVLRKEISELVEHFDTPSALSKLANIKEAIDYAVNEDLYLLFEGD